VATVRANCPECGDVELTTRDLQVLTCSATQDSTYSFVCPGCCLVVNKPVDLQMVKLLLSAGVRQHEWDMPAELYEPHSGPPITYDDLLGFHYELAALDWLQHITATDQ